MARPKRLNWVCSCGKPAIAKDMCAVCYQKEDRKTNPEKHRLKARRLLERASNWLSEIKDAPCADCRHKYPHYVMEFDHLDSSTKIKSVSKMLKQHAPKQRILDEIAKCELVCANCHATRTYWRAQSGKN